MSTGEEMLFSGFSEEERRDFLSIGQEKHFESQEYIVRNGASGNSLFILREGKASVWRKDVKLTDLVKGDIFGESVIFQAHSRIAAVRSDGPSEVLEIRREDLLRFFKWREERLFKVLVINIVHLLFGKLGRTNERIESLEKDLREQAAWT
jgi:CRP-like cAMP-binding protein